MYAAVEAQLTDLSDGSYPLLPLRFITNSKEERSEQTMGIIETSGVNQLAQICIDVNAVGFLDFGSGPANLCPPISALASIPSTGVELNAGYFDYQTLLFQWLANAFPSNQATISTFGNMFSWHPPTFGLDGMVVGFCNNEKLQVPDAVLPF